MAVPLPTPVLLCESVDVFAGSSPAKPGGTSAFAIWVSSTGATSTGVTVTLTTKPTAAKPTFAVCPSGHTTKCTLSTLGTGPVELQATVAVPKSSTNGERVTLTAKMTSTTPKATVSASAAITVVVSPTPTPAATPLPAFGLSGPLLPPFTALPLTASPGGNVGPLFPPVTGAGPTPTIQPASGAGAPAPAAAVGPLSRQLLGTQLIGLAALLAAIGIVVARFTLRTPRTVRGVSLRSGTKAADAKTAISAKTAANAKTAMTAATAVATSTAAEATDSTATDASTAIEGSSATDASTVADGGTAKSSEAGEDPGQQGAASG